MGKFLVSFEMPLPVILLLMSLLGEARSAEIDVQARVDLHLDTPTQLLLKGLGINASEGLEAGLPQLAEGGTNVGIFVLWPPRKTDHLARTRALLDVMEREIGEQPGLALGTSVEQVQGLLRDGKRVALISMEGAHGLGTGDWQTVFDELYGRGLRLMGLTWSFSNRFAGSSGDGGGGLTEEGQDLVATLWKTGVVVDLSHASRATTLEVCGMAPVPVIASHSNAHALTPHPRNLTDEEIRCIADTGGVIGLNLHAPFVGSGADVARVADHAEHLAQVGGHRVVALGSDFDGFIRKPVGLAHAGQIGALWDELARRGWSLDQLRGVQGANFMTAWTLAQTGVSGTPQQDTP